MRAIQIENEEQRREFVKNECADDLALTARMSSLLRALGEDSTFLETPAVSFDAAILPEPMSITGYTIERAIGAGGMATVYEAMQHRPQRRVALKVMRRALTQTSAVQRFRFETETLASLRHPNIAQLYEVGASDDGHGVSTPYFAMEFVPDALTLTAYASERQCALDEKLHLFLDVCNAVHHGHQLGVIHRDLKPGNVLVDTEGRCKVIDFGIARSTDPDSERLTMDADSGHVIGTLNYMSPEQHKGRSDDLDIRTDIYSLGVLLYELACQRLPHDLSKSSLSEAARVVNEITPLRPGSIDPRLRGDLEAVILKALEPDRERRYQSVSALNADVQRFLNSEPVLARSAPMMYRLRRFARRHRGLVAGAGAVALALSIGFAATVRQAIIATNARNEAVTARNNEREQRVLAETREAELGQVVEFQEAQINLLDVRAMGDSIRNDLRERASDTAVETDLSAFYVVLDEINFVDVARQAVDEQLLGRSREAIDEQFAEQPELRARLLFALAGTANDLGLFDRADDALTDALDIRESVLGDEHEDTLETIASLGALRMTQGRSEESITLLRRAAEGMAKTLGPEHSRTLNTRNNIALVMRKLGDNEGAERELKDLVETHRRLNGEDDPEAIAALHNLGLVYAMQSKNDEAYECWSEVTERYRRLREPDDPDLERVVSNLGRLLMFSSRYEEAEPYLRQTMDARRERLGEDHPATLSISNSYAALLRSLERFDEAENLLQSVIAGTRHAHGDEHESVFLAIADLGDVYASQGRYAESEATHREAYAGYAAATNPNTEIALIMLKNIGETLIWQERYTEGLALIDEAVAALREHHGENSSRLGYMLTERANALAALGRFPEAESAAIEAYENFLKWNGAEFDRTVYAAGVVATVYEKWNDTEPTPELSQKAERWRKAQSGTDPANDSVDQN